MALVIHPDHIGRVQPVELVDLAAIGDLDFPAQPVAKHPGAQLEHVIQQIAKAILVQRVDYNDHIHPPA